MLASIPGIPIWIAILLVVFGAVGCVFARGFRRTLALVAVAAGFLAFFHPPSPDIRIREDRSPVPIEDAEGRSGQPAQNAEPGSPPATPTDTALLPSSETGAADVDIAYTWEGGSNRCSGATAKLNGVVVGTAKMKGVGGDEQSGYYVEVEEVQYAPDAPDEQIYRGILRFRIGARGTKIGETPISGTKRYDLFVEWPMGRD